MEETIPALPAAKGIPSRKRAISVSSTEDHEAVVIDEQKSTNPTAMDLDDDVVVIKEEKVAPTILIVDDEEGATAAPLVNFDDDVIFIKEEASDLFIIDDDEDEVSATRPKHIEDEGLFVKDESLSSRRIATPRSRLPTPIKSEVKQELPSPDSNRFNPSRPNRFQSIDFQPAPGSAAAEQDRDWTDNQPDPQDGAFEDGSDFSAQQGESPQSEDSDRGSQGTPRKKTRRAVLKTAREYWAQHYNLLPPEKHRGVNWRRKELKKIDQEARAFKKRNVKKSLRKVALPLKKRGAVQGTALRGLRNHATFGDDYVDPEQDDEPIVNVSTKAGLKKAILKDFDVRTKNAGNMDQKKAKEDYNYLNTASKTLGYMQVTPANAYWKLKGMKTTLYNHQMTGVSWMVERECSPGGPFGGILADDMGLGKTIQIFGTMIANPPTEEHIKRGQKTTLIVVMSSLRRQWFDEIQKHTDYEKVMLFKSSNEDNNLSRLAQEDIVLTTYHEVMNSLPFPDKDTIERFRRKKIDVDKAIQNWIEENMDDVGLLHQVNWYRIVFDEGHMIKNFKIRTSKAAIALKGGYRWSLSGTPIMNCYEEFYPTLRFLNDPLTLKYDYANFQSQFCDPENETSFRKLECLLTELILRRSMQDIIYGKPILPLEKPTKEIWKVKLPFPERFLYQAVEKRFLELLNAHLPKTHPRKMLTYLLCQLTRLRQLVSNPDIIDQQIKIMFDVHELKKMKTDLLNFRISDKLNDLRQTLVSRVATWIKEKEVEARNPKTQTDEDVRCSMCQLPLDDLVMIKKKKCHHIFCEWCIDVNAPVDMENDDEMRHCPFADCGVSFTDNDVKPYHPPGSAPQRSNPNSRVPKKGKDCRNFRPSISGNQVSAIQWLKKYDGQKIETINSAKLRGIMGQLCAWQAEAPDDKVIIFTSWILFSIMLGSSIEKKNIGFVYFTGDMSHKQRSAAIESFNNDPTVTVMISGLGCGSVGLNLAVANRVILCNPWWNICIENQALGRVFRFGQKKKVYLTRIICDQTVDTEILELQVKKIEIISDIMNEEPNTLTTEEIATLIGIRTTDGFGNIIIESRYEDWETWDYDEDENYDSDVGGGPDRT